MPDRAFQIDHAVSAIRHRRPLIATLTGSTLAIVLVLPTLAATTASIANLTLAAVTVKHVAQNQPGTLALTVTDTVGLGWNVTVQSSAAKYSGAFGTTPANDIPAANLSLGTPATPVWVSGQLINGTNGPKAVGTGGVLGSPIKVINANSGYGKGTYTQSLPLSVSVPANPRQGTYTATLTVTITAGP
jgi:hypothetical protein